MGLISTCPECGRSYPTHHGNMCKLCAKKAGAPAASSPAAAPTKTASSPVAKTVAGTSTPAAARATTATPANPPTARPASPVAKSSAASMFMDDLIPDPAAVAASGGSSSDSDGEEKEKKKGVVKCRHCSFEQDDSNVFCESCKKMLLASVGNNKPIDFKLSEMKGALPNHLTALKKIGVSSTLQLLDKGSNKIKRKTLSLKTKVSETLLLRMVHQADLMRVPSIEPEQAFLLECIGINSVATLVKKDAKGILATVKKQDAMLKAKKIFINPNESELGNWIDEAKKMEPKVKS